MKFGDALRAVFEGHYSDLSSEEGTRYTNEKLIEAIKTTPLSFWKHLYTELAVCSEIIRKETLKTCKHEKFKYLWEECKECCSCGATQRYELLDEEKASWYEAKEWKEWRL